MKKSFLYLLPLYLSFTFHLITGCQEDSTIATTPKGNPSSMSFSVSVEETRSGYASTSLNEIEGSFWLHIRKGSDIIYDGNADYVDGVVTLENEDYLTEGELIWPENRDDSVNIVAIYADYAWDYNPMSILVTDQTSGEDIPVVVPDYLPWTSDATNTEGNAQPTTDLLVAHVVTTRNLNKSSVIGLNFKHKLACVQASVKTMSSDYVCRISEIKVTSKKHSALRLSPTNAAEDIWMGLSTYEYYAPTVLEQQLGSEVSEAWIRFNNGHAYADPAETETFYLFKQANENEFLDPSASTDGEYVTLTDSETGLPLQTFICPQLWESSTFYVTYSIWSTATTLEGQTLPYQKILESTAQKAVILEAGKIYNFRLAMNGLSLVFLGDNIDNPHPD